MRLLISLINYFYYKTTLAKKIAFYICEEYLLQHYENIFNKLDPNTYDIMTTNLKSSDVISAIEEKIALKKKLREAKKASDDSATKKISKKIDKIEDKLHSTPLSKT